MPRHTPTTTASPAPTAAAIAVLLGEQQEAPTLAAPGLQIAVTSPMPTVTTVVGTGLAALATAKAAQEATPLAAPGPQVVLVSPMPSVAAVAATAAAAAPPFMATPAPKG